MQQVLRGRNRRAFGIRLNEHRKEAEQITRRKYTRATRKDSLDEVHKSAISNHVAQQFRSIFPTFPQTCLIFFLTREGPDYATACTTVDPSQMWR